MDNQSEGEKAELTNKQAHSPSLALLNYHGQSDCLEAPQKFRYGTPASKIQVSKQENFRGVFWGALLFFLSLVQLLTFLGSKQKSSTQLI